MDSLPYGEVTVWLFFVCGVYGCSVHRNIYCSLLNYSNKENTEEQNLLTWSYDRPVYIFIFIGILFSMFGSTYRYKHNVNEHIRIHANQYQAFSVYMHWVFIVMPGYG